MSEGLSQPIRVHAPQSGQTALAAQDYNTALYWFELVQTWAPSSLQAEVELCKAAGAIAALPVRLLLAALHFAARHYLLRMWVYRSWGHLNMTDDAMAIWMQVHPGKASVWACICSLLVFCSRLQRCTLGT